MIVCTVDKLIRYPLARSKHHKLAQRNTQLSAQAVLTAQAALATDRGKRVQGRLQRLRARAASYTSSPKKLFPATALPRARCCTS